MERSMCSGRGCSQHDCCSRCNTALRRDPLYRLAARAYRRDMFLRKELIMTRYPHTAFDTPLHIARHTPARPRPPRLSARHALAAMLLSLLGVSATVSLEANPDVTTSAAIED